MVGTWYPHCILRNKHFESQNVVHLGLDMRHYIGRERMGWMTKDFLEREIDGLHNNDSVKFTDSTG